jgi:hypothetical protein
MNLLRESSLRDYWSTHQNPYASSVGMSRNRFQALLTVFHLNNNDAVPAKGQPGYDPQFKIWPVIDTSLQFQDVYTAEEQMTIDEAMCPFQRHISFRVYIKGKPHKYGIKIFELCVAKSGYVYNLKVLGHILPTQNTTQHSVLLTGCVIK